MYLCVYVLCKDKDSKFRLILVESRIHRLADQPLIISRPHSGGSTTATQANIPSKGEHRCTHLFIPQTGFSLMGFLPG